MAKSPPPPELVEAYRLLKAGQRQAAGQKLQAYMADHKDDPQAWWLMAHAVGKPDHVRRCLESVLKLDPTHEKARAKLAKLQPAPEPQPAAPPPPPRRASSHSIEEPDDSMFFGGSASAPPATPVAEPATVPAPDASPPPPREPAPPPRPASAPESAADAPSFEEFAASTPGSAGPFGAPPADDPFGDIPPDGDDPFAADAAQAPGTGNQPDWGPGLAYVSDDAGAASAGAPPIPGAPASTPGADRPPPPKPTGQRLDAGFEDFVAETRKSGLEAAIGYSLIAIALVVLVGLALYVAVNGIGGGSDGVPALTALDGGSFTIDYPKGWDTKCLNEALGYRVCGVANHEFYNEAQWYATEEVNLGEMMSQAFSMAFTGGSLPDDTISIIVMDVPRNSPAYDNGSAAKTSYEWYQKGWGFVSDEATVTYDRQEIAVDGHPAYYYEYIVTDPVAEKEGWSGREEIYDVYVEHDGIVLWMTVSVLADVGDDSYRDTVQAMIESIEIKPPEQW